MNVMVTGGAGFVGSYLARRLLEKHHRVVVVDNLSTGRRENIPPEVEFIDLDLSRPDCLGDLPTDVDAVCHLAAQSAGAVSAEQPYYDLQANAGSTLLLSRWCLKQGIKRFLYASSMVVYGDRNRSPVSEDSLCLPKAYYGVSKLTSEHLLRLAAVEGLQVTIFRMFTLYGPGQDLSNLKQGMVSIYLAYLLRGGPVPVTGSLNRFRDLLCIDDVIDAWEAALDLPSTPSQIYNLGSGTPTTVRELLARLKAALDLPPAHPVQELPGSPADQFGAYADISRARTELGFAPRIELAEGLRRMVAWARAQSVA